MLVSMTETSDNPDIVQLDDSRVAIARRLPDGLQENYNPLADDDEGRLAKFILWDDRGREVLGSFGDLSAIAEKDGVATRMTPDEDIIGHLRDNAERLGLMILPVYRMEHGLVDYSTSRFSDRWDSGWSGIAWAMKDDYLAAGVNPAHFGESVRGLLADYTAFCNDGAWEVAVAQAEIEDGVLCGDPDRMGCEDGEIFYGAENARARLRELVAEEKASPGM